MSSAPLGQGVNNPVPVTPPPVTTRDNFIYKMGKFTLKVVPFPN